MKATAILSVGAIVLWLGLWSGAQEKKEYRESWTAISKVVGVRVEWEVLQGQHGTPDKPRDNDGEQFPGWILEPHVGDTVVGSTRTKYKIVSREHRWSANAQDRAVMIVRLEILEE